MYPTIILIIALGFSAFTLDSLIIDFIAAIVKPAGISAKERVTSAVMMIIASVLWGWFYYLTH